MSSNSCIAISSCRLWTVGNENIDVGKGIIRSMLW